VPMRNSAILQSCVTAGSGFPAGPTFASSEQPLAIAQQTCLPGSARRISRQPVIGGHSAGVVWEGCLELAWAATPFCLGRWPMGAWPEVKLGLLRCSGTQRLARLLGAEGALI